MKTASLRLLSAAGAAGALGGMLSFFLILRLNPHIPSTPATLAWGLALWTSWGAFILGFPLWLVSAFSRRFFASRGASIGDACALLLWLVSFAGALLFWLNAVIHPEFVSRTIQRQLQQDAAVWLAASMLIVLVWRLWRGRGRSPKTGASLVLLLFLLPLLRLWDVPPQSGAPTRLPSGTLSPETRNLLVCGIEGLDLGFLKGRGPTTRLRALPELKREASFGALRAFRPFLRAAAWTTVATGVLPRRHGVTSASVWGIPLFSDEDVRLLPWTPNGSRLFLPWGLGRKKDSPPSAVPPLWTLLSPENTATVLSWPGFPSQGSGQTIKTGPAAELVSLREELQSFLETAFPRSVDPVLSALNEDLRHVLQAELALRSRRGPVFLNLRTLAVSRRLLEPHGPGEARRREALRLVLEFLDTATGRLLSAAGETAPVVVLSPYGMAPPDSYERLKRLLGSGKNWRASAENAPDGLLVLKAPGVLAGREFSRVRMEDLAPTLCYLLDLPIPQHMEGRVILEAVDPVWASSHPLRVIDTTGGRRSAPAPGLSEIQDPS